MEPNHKTLPPSLVEMNSGFDYSAESRAPQMPEMQQQPKISPSPQTPAMKSPPRPIVKAMILTTRADWVNTLWVDISSQLRRLSVISDDLFDGLLLKRNTFTGSVILRELRKKYEELGDDRNLATVRVVAPETLMGEVWRLLWTIKRHRDPNGRQFHSEKAIEPINHQNHVELDPNPGQTHSSNHFLLPPFIQDYGPGPSEFDPDPDSDFDTVMRDIMTDVNTGVWKGE